MNYPSSPLNIISVSLIDFFGHIDKLDFALAHNGVLHNDNELRIAERLPKTNIQTDSYVAVQLIEKENALGFDAIRKMAEKTEGSFCYTILDDKNNLYIVKGDNPMAIYKFNGFYLYASTDEILTRAVKKIGLKNYSRINISCGDILKITPNGTIEIQTFHLSDLLYHSQKYSLRTGYYMHSDTAVYFVSAHVFAAKASFQCLE